MLNCNDANNMARFILSHASSMLNDSALKKSIFLEFFPRINYMKAFSFLTKKVF